MFTDSKVCLSKSGTITIQPDGRIIAEGFAGNASCREMAILAAVWGIEQLQRELMATLHHPGGGKIVIG